MVTAFGLGAAISVTPMPASAQPASPGAPGTTPSPATNKAAPSAAIPPLPPEPELVLERPDLALDELLRGAPSLRIALLEVERTEGVRREALAASLPNLSLSGSVLHHFLRNDATQLDSSGNIVTREFPTTPTASASLTLRQPVFAPRAWHAVQMAALATQTAELQEDDQRRVLVASLAESVIAVVTSQRVASLRREQLAATLERARLAKSSVDLGAGTAIDALRAEQSVSEARLSVVTADEDLLQAQEALGLLLGHNQGVGVASQFDIGALGRLATERCRPVRPEDRSDVRAAEARVALAEAEVTDAALAFLPQAEVSTTLAYGSEPFVANRHIAWSIQALISVPLYDGGARYGAHQAARASLAQAREERAQVLETAEVEVSQTRRASGVAETARAQAAESLQIAAELDRLTQRLYREGGGTTLELVDAGERLSSAQIELAIRDFEASLGRIQAAIAGADCAGGS